MSIWDEVRKLGYRVVFKRDYDVALCIACYNVIYRGKNIRAASWLDIPDGEIWIFEPFRKYAEYILFHELQEIKYRAEGYTSDEAHELALRDEEARFGDDENWKRLKSEINICTFDSLIAVPGIGITLAERIMEHRPYYSMEDLLKVPGIGKKTYELLRERFWCVGD
ncbi:MAG: helix-hairpin-helix domain-containing protein [Euryarchaeota archaeon]|nr:helix-hairpin-helix domain-containing protein [Euryarchaeota archaeon]